MYNSVLLHICAHNRPTDIQDEPDCPEKPHSRLPNSVARCELIEKILGIPYLIQIEFPPFWDFWNEQIRITLQHFVSQIFQQWLCPRLQHVSRKSHAHPQMTNLHNSNGILGAISATPLSLLGNGGNAVPLIQTTG